MCEWSQPHTIKKNVQDTYTKATQSAASYMQLTTYRNTYLQFQYYHTTLIHFCGRKICLGTLIKAHYTHVPPAV